ncbi:MAG: hypothetical protein GXO79_06695 [Chlorobi bacterium]|nr:hypothetical protein [Chlorobiota bacterium]
MITLGIHIGHDGGCAIAKNGQILYAIAEERLTRHKYHNGWISSMFYCIQHAGLKPQNIDIVIFSNSGANFNKTKANFLYSWGFTTKTKILFCDHHLSHAIGAISLSEFNDGIVFVGDAGGNNSDTESAYVFSESNIEKVYGNASRPNFKGLGTTYEAFTNLLGFSDQESGKVMALAAYGDSSHFNNNLFDISPQGLITSKLNDYHRWGALAYLRENDLKYSYEDLADSKSIKAKDIAAFIQDSFRETLIQVLKLLLSKHSVENLILAGGIALNCSTNGSIRDRNISKDLFVSPVASDIGLPIGNAVYGFYIISKIIAKQNNRSMSFGYDYSEKEILQAIARDPDLIQPGSLRPCSHYHYKSTNIYKEGAEMIDGGLIVGWFQNRSESGPRALGSRSILTKVNGLNARNKINMKVKHREWFRPFGPSILKADLSILGFNDRISSYMTEAVMVSNQTLDKLDNCIHVDGTSRIHSVDEFTNTHYYQLLEYIKEKQGYGAVLNTSFNVKEPIVETPSDALSTFIRSNMDCLILGEYIIKKKI